MPTEDRIEWEPLPGSTPLMTHTDHLPLSQQIANEAADAADTVIEAAEEVGHAVTGFASRMLRVPRTLASRLRRRRAGKEQQAADAATPGAPGSAAVRSKERNEDVEGVFVMLTTAALMVGFARPPAVYRLGALLGLSGRGGGRGQGPSTATDAPRAHAPAGATADRRA